MDTTYVSVPSLTQKVSILTQIFYSEGDHFKLQNSVEFKFFLVGIEDRLFFPNF